MSPTESASTTSVGVAQEEARENIARYLSEHQDENGRLNQMQLHDVEAED